MYKLYKDWESESFKKRVFNVISKHGWMVEHKYDYFASLMADEEEGVFYGTQDSGLLAVRNGKIWEIIAEPMSSDKLTLMKSFVDNVLTLGDKIHCEMTPEFYNVLKKELKTGKVTDVYTCPIIDLKKWDVSLNGSDFSKLRKMYNRYNRNYKIEQFNDYSSFDIKEIEKVVISWRKNRKGKDRTTYKKYIQYFADKSKPDACLLLKIDGKLHAIAAGWNIPNSKGIYYSISLHDYSIPELGDYLNVSFFKVLKEKGYDFLDFGGSTDGLLEYKRKFGPVREYAINCFYVKK